MRTPTELSEALSHIVYEYNMLIGTASLMNDINILRNSPNTPLNNIENKFISDYNKNSILESFIIHARNLIDFFNGKESKKDDDILLRDFNVNKDLYKVFVYHPLELEKTEIEKQYDRMCKEISHLTYKRTNNENFKQWDLDDIKKIITERFNGFITEIKSSMPNINLTDI